MDATARFFSADELDSFRHDTAAPQLIDCRSEAEFASGHIPGSVNIPVEQLSVRSHDVDPARPVVFICASGRRARLAADLVAGGTSVAVLEGGVSAWSRSGRELIVTGPSTWSLERQVRLVAGVLTGAGGLAAIFVDPRWAVVPAAVGVGLAAAALTNTCAMASLLMQMPWNRRQA